MKIIIEIPEDEFGIDINDKFQDFFERVKVDIAHRINAHDTLLCGNYEIETAEMFLASFKRMTIIPSNATNGDVIKVMFPHYDIEIEEHKGYVRVFYENFYTTYPLRWWNAPYINTKLSTICDDCRYYDGEVHAECVVCEKGGRT